MSRRISGSSEAHCVALKVPLDFAQWPLSAALEEEMTMAWTTPTLVEICIGLEINGYLPAEF
jgi:coenzyme PQQ precursor peptide PqqA